MTISYARRVSLRTLFCSIVLLAAGSFDSNAQENAVIYLDSTAQVIRGFGAANIVGWRPDMTDAEIETAFGTGEGKLGFSILRVRIPPESGQWSSNVRTARQAHSMGATIIASPWSPPAAMKTNESLVGGELRDDMFDDYAEHLNSFNTYMADNDVPVYAISVQNEPDVDVDYESCDWSAGGMLRFVREHATAIDTKVMAPESFQFRRQMSDLLLIDGSAAANLDIVAGHIYGGGLAPYPLAEDKGKEIWMTEHLVLETDLEASLGTAVEIQNVMKAGMSAYVWWYIVRYYGPISDGESGEYGKGEITRRGYFMSQFSRFIRPGFVRVHAEDPSGGSSSGVSITAYKDTSGVVVVAINDGSSPREFEVVLDGGTVGGFEQYVTSETQNVEKGDDVAVSDGRFTVNLGANSATTLVSENPALFEEEDASLPRSHQLFQNYPNPFNPETTISYAVPRAGNVTLTVFDVLGREIETLVDGMVPAGRHESSFDASGLSSGVYLYQLEAMDLVKTRHMTVMR